MTEKTKTASDQKFRSPYEQEVYKQQHLN